MSCLFDSLSKFSGGMQTDILRLHICDYLQTNPVLFDDLRAADVVKHEVNMTLANYVANMRLSGTMGGATEIRAFTKLFKKNVLVKSLPNGKNIEFIENSRYSWCGLVWTGGHFDPIL